MEVEATGNPYFRETTEEPQVDGEPLKTSGSDVAPPMSSNNGCLDCNICLDLTVDPVITLCGHLYCWPCIYRWLQQVESQQCPVCKASLSDSELIPLYGRGHSTAKRSHQSLADIPRRPSIRRDNPGSEPESPRANPPPIQRQHYQQRDRNYYGYPYGDYISPPLSPLGTPRVVHSMAGGVLGGMIAVLPWIRNQEADVGVYYSSPYQMAGSGGGGGGVGSPRMRRQEMQVEKSLHQIWVFFFFCAFLCLVLF